MPLERVRVLWRGHGMEIDDGVYQFRVCWFFMLQLNPLSKGASVVAQVWDAGGLDAREDDFSDTARLCVTCAPIVPYLVGTMTAEKSIAGTDTVVVAWCQGRGREMNPAARMQAALVHRVGYFRYLAALDGGAPLL